MSKYETNKWMNKCVQLRADLAKAEEENKNWKQRYIEAVSDIVSLKKKTTKLEQVLKAGK